MKRKMPSLTQLLCPHKERMTRFVDGRIFTVCFDVGRNPEVWRWVDSFTPLKRKQE